MNLSSFEKKIFSQNGEDGITEKLIELIYDDPKDKYYVEFGVHDGEECNTKILREKYAWKGLQMDGSNENLSINLKREFITKENIVSLFSKYNVPKQINLLSVDIDFNDFYCLKEILKEYTCDIIICEYNATHLPTEDKVVPYNINGRWDGITTFFGASLLTLYKLAIKYDYSLVYCEKKGVNCFFVNNALISRKQLNFDNINNIEKIYRQPGYGNGPRNGHLQDRYNRQYINFDEAFNS
jgi:hypothetical protein